MSTLKVYTVEGLSEGMQEKQGRSARCSGKKKELISQNKKSSRAQKKKSKHSNVHQNEIEVTKKKPHTPQPYRGQLSFPNGNLIVGPLWQDGLMT